MLVSEIVFGNHEWQAVLFGIEISIFVGILVLFAVYPIQLFAKTVKSVAR